MQSIEGEVWRDRALLLAHAAWNRENRDAIACILQLGEPDDRPFRSDLRKNYPDELTDEDILEAFQRMFMRGFGKRLDRSGEGPSQWSDPTPILDTGTVAYHAGVTNDAVRAACRRGALRHLKLDGYGNTYFIRLPDAERYFGAWDSDKSHRIAVEMRDSGHTLVIREDVAYMLPSLKPGEPGRSSAK